MAEMRTDLPVYQEVDGHFDPTPFYVTRDMYDGLPFEVAGGPIDHLVGRPVAALHTHDFPEVYLLVSPTPGNARIEVTVGEETFEVVSPATVHVPAGIPHRFLTLAAEPGSYCLGLLVTAA
jgi:mannose-6-phosphate isomerase-like protein (cupin superfamily)